MTPSAYHSPSVHPGVLSGVTTLTPYNRVVSQPEPSVTVIEPLIVQPVQPLTFSEPDEYGTIWAELSHEQTCKLSIHLRRVLNLDTPFRHIMVAKQADGFLCVHFAVDPRIMHCQVITPVMHKGLEIVFVSGMSVAFAWTVLKNANWPNWLKN